MEFKRLSGKYKNNKLSYYALNYWRQLAPSAGYKKRLEQLKAKPLNWPEVQRRAEYYNQLSQSIASPYKAKKISDLKLKDGYKTYFFDFYEYLRRFPEHLKVSYLFGDVTTVPEQPTFVKSRPVGEGNQNSILLKWNKIRHFTFVDNDPNSYESKQNLLLSRGKVHPTQPHRIAFLERYFGHALCNIGKVNSNSLNPAWLVPRMTISEQLNYKFILCLAGNDVASNLKWVMSSNSVAVMPRPKIESWFMEASLKPNYHYIALKDDYSDLEQQLNYYLSHPQKALAIIKNAQAYVAQFKNYAQEEAISLLVLKKYFEQSGQLK